jgi:glycosyltransferase involved in cell wall biosynthesis
MRIVQAVGWYFPDSIGGTEIYVDALSQELRRRGHDVRVAAPDPAHASERRYVHDRVPVYRYPIPPYPSRVEARGLSLVRGAERFHRWLADERPDVVHLHTFVTGLGLAEVEAARALGVRIVVTTHSASLGFLCERGTMLQRGRTLCDARVAPEVCAACAIEQRGVPYRVAETVVRAGALLPPGVRPGGRAGTALALTALVAERRVAQARLFDLVDAFVVLSRWARDVVIANGGPPDKVHVNPLAVSARPGGWPSKASPADRPTRPPVRVGFLGRAEAVKGLEDLIAALRRVPARVPIAVEAIVIASSQTERRGLARARRLAAGDPRVSILPAVSPRDVPAALSRFDVLCCPSKAVEGGPTVALEAHAVGTPVIGSDIPAISEIVSPGTTGALFPPGNRTALARLLTDLATRPEQIDHWRTNTRPPRTFDAVVADYLALYTA